MAVESLERHKSLAPVCPHETTNGVLGRSRVVPNQPGKLDAWIELRVVVPVMNLIWRFVLPFAPHRPHVGVNHVVLPRWVPVFSSKFTRAEESPSKVISELLNTDLTPDLGWTAEPSWRAAAVVIGRHEHVVDHAGESTWVAANLRLHELADVRRY
jgi:hypothetical protein